MFGEHEDTTQPWRQMIVIRKVRGAQRRRAKDDPTIVCNPRHWKAGSVEVAAESLPTTFDRVIGRYALPILVHRSDEDVAVFGVIGKQIDLHGLPTRAGSALRPLRCGTALPRSTQAVACRSARSRTGSDRGQQSWGGRATCTHRSDPAGPAPSRASRYRGVRRPESRP